jgi:hypothetical protein
MHIHIGGRIIVSDRNIVGIFNSETILASETNSNYHDKVKKGDKTVIIDRENKVISSIVSSYTIMKRDVLKDGVVWRRKDEQNVHS